MDEPLKTVLLKRVLPGLILLAMGFASLYFTDRRGGEGLVVGVRTLASFVFLLPGAIFLAHPVATLIATQFANILYPEDHDYSPPPLYRLPEMYIRQNRHGDAVQEYQKILHHHPREIRAYLALLEVAFQLMQDPVLGEKTYRTGLRRLKNVGDRVKLEETYQALRAGAPLPSSSIESYP